MFPESSPVTFIEPFKRDEHASETPLAMIEAHVISRQGYFLSTLADTISHTKIHETGREIISLNPDGTITKKIESRAHQSAESLFTGSRICSLAAMVLVTALENFVIQHRFPILVGIGEVSTSAYGEEWGTAVRQGGISHAIVQVVDLTTQQTTFFDPTYAQVNHRFLGKIVAIPRKELAQFYKTKNGSSIFKLHPEFLTPKRFQPFLKEGYSATDLEELIRTLTS